MGLDDIAHASLQDTLLVHSCLGRTVAGFHQLSDIGPVHFLLGEELRLITIVYHQVAAIIENATLMQQSRQRAQR
jgi:GAF domain-containing protein